MSEKNDLRQEIADLEAGAAHLMKQYADECARSDTRRIQRDNLQAAYNDEVKTGWGLAKDLDSKQRANDMLNDANKKLIEQGEELIELATQIGTERDELAAALNDVREQRDDYRDMYNAVYDALWAIVGDVGTGDHLIDTPAVMIAKHDNLKGELGRLRVDYDRRRQEIAACQRECEELKRVRVTTRKKKNQRELAEYARLKKKYG